MTFFFLSVNGNICQFKELPNIEHEGPFGKSLKNKEITNASMIFM